MALGSMMAGTAMFRSTIGLLVVGLLLAGLRKLPLKLWDWLVSRVVFAVDIAHPDPAVEWVKIWMMAHPGVTRVRRFNARTRDALVSGGKQAVSPHSETRGKPQLDLEPAPGTYLHVFQGTLLWITCRLDKKEKDAVVVGYEEGLTIRFLGGNRSQFDALINAAQAEAANRADRGVKVLVSSFGQWKPVGMRSHRPPETLVFDGDLCRDLLSDVNTFLSQRDWYQRMGIPWRRGYLLFGEPGNGKTSLVLTVAGETKARLYSINLGSASMTDERLEFLLSDIPNGSIILLEDIDALFSGRRKAERSVEASFAGLLNALDGVSSGEGRLVFMTANHVDKLDPALVRPGRIDVHIQVGNASREQMFRMFQRFYPEASESLARAFADQLPERSVSMARLQEHFLRHRSDVTAAFENSYLLSLATQQVSSSETFVP